MEQLQNTKNDREFILKWQWKCEEQFLVQTYLADTGFVIDLKSYNDVIIIIIMCLRVSIRNNKHKSTYTVILFARKRHFSKLVKQNDFY